MNNALKFYKTSTELLNFLDKNLKDANFSYAKVQNLLLKERTYTKKEEIFDDVVAFFHLCNSALLGINREKIENSVETNWDDYKPQNYLKASKMFYSGSQIPYFREWLGIFKCQERFKNEPSGFWIKKIRDILMHGNYDLDFESGRNPSGPKMKIKEIGKSGVVFDAHVAELGLNEFIEDNFTNIFKDDIGIVSDDYYFSMNIKSRISNKDELKQTLDDLVIIKRQVSDGVVFNGMKITDKQTGEMITGMGKTVVDKSGKKVEFIGPKYLDEKNFTSYKMSDEIKETLIYLLEKNNIYTHSSQTSLIRDVINEYCIFNRSLCANIDNFKHLMEEFVFKDEKTVQKTVKPTLASLYKHRANIDAALTFLSLYKMLYVLQNDAFPEIDKTKIDFNAFMVLPLTTEDYINKIEKKMQAENKKFDESYKELVFETIRNSLAHGNISVATRVVDDKPVRYVVFSDKWKNRRTEEEENVTLFAPIQDVKKFVKEVDSQIINYIKLEQFTKDYKIDASKLDDNEV